jgi:alpha-tubulin suppressor-like RCC1 family protein
MVLVDRRASITTSTSATPVYDTFTITPASDAATQVAESVYPQQPQAGQAVTLLAQLLDAAGLPTDNGGTASLLGFYPEPPATIAAPAAAAAPNGNASPGRCAGPGAAGAAWTDSRQGEVLCTVTNPTAGDVPVTVEFVGAAQTVPQDVVGLPNADPVVEVAAAAYHSLAVTASGAVYAWGDNANGELGDGTLVNRYQPVRTSIPSGMTVAALAGGGYFSVALTSSGQVLSWGANYDGQLGDGTKVTRDLPGSVELPSGTTVTAIAAGCNDSMALTTDGQVFTWGQNTDGSLGNGDTTDSSVPAMAGLPNGVSVSAIAAGCSFDLALASNGGVWAWGEGADGELGNGTTPAYSTTPVEVAIPAGTVVTGIAADAFDGLVLTSTGAVLAWGANGNGELGNGTTAPESEPGSVTFPSGTVIRAIAGGGFNNLALTSSGEALGWGLNANGQVGAGGETEALLPVEVAIPAGTTISRVAAASAGGFHDLAVTATGQVLAWGANYDAQLGNGTISQTFASLALNDSGRLFATGANGFGQLGIGTTSDSNVPAAVSMPAGDVVASASEGCVHSLALTTGHAVLSWGGNFDGQLGNGSTQSSDAPGPVAIAAGVVPTAVAAGCLHSLALTSTGRVLAWGANFAGQLGDGTTISSARPVAVSVPGGISVAAVAAGCDHSLALTSAGQVLAWGAGADGQLGDGSTSASTTPVSVDLPGGTVVTAIAAGCDHTLALTSTGAVFAWGEGTAGQLGDGSYISSDLPVQVLLPAGVVVTAVAAGLTHSVALTSTGEVLGWGFDGDGQLGAGVNVNSSINFDTPVAASLPTGYVASFISAGGNSTFSIGKTGALGWGGNIFGQLGNGSNTTKTLPYPVDSGALAALVSGGANGEDLLSPAGPVAATVVVDFG